LLATPLSEAEAYIGNDPRVVIADFDVFDGEAVSFSSFRIPDFFLAKKSWAIIRVSPPDALGGSSFFWTILLESLVDGEDPCF